MHKALVLLNGCGHRDGSEIHEAVFALEACEAYFDSYQVVCPDGRLAGVVNHCSGDEEKGLPRVMIEESARISRGKSLPLKDCNFSEFQALIIPGGFGVARNLCNFAAAGQEMEVRKDVADLLHWFHGAKRPVGLICIAPVLAAKVLGSRNPVLTLGDSKETESILTGWGARMEKCAPGEFLCDKDNHLFSTPAYMHAESRLSDIRRGIRLMVEDMRKHCVV